MKELREKQKKKKENEEKTWEKGNKENTMNEN